MSGAASGLVHIGLTLVLPLSQWFMASLPLDHEGLLVLNLGYSGAPLLFWVPLLAALSSMVHALSRTALIEDLDATLA